MGSKQGQRWLWWVEDATTGEVVAFVFGRRTHGTFRTLLALLEESRIEAGLSYKNGQVAVSPTFVVATRQSHDCHCLPNQNYHIFSAP